MSAYKFETDQFGISDSEIHLLRSRFNYETIEFTSIDSITIGRGRQVANWFALLIIGLILFGVGSFAAGKVIYEYFLADNFRLFYMEQFVLPVLPVVLGAVSLYHSLKSGPVLQVGINTKTKQFPLGQLKKEAQIESLAGFFSSNPLTKHKFKGTTTEA